jgi:hypothetical protein
MNAEITERGRIFLITDAQVARQENHVLRILRLRNAAIDRYARAEVTMLQRPQSHSQPSPPAYNVRRRDLLASARPQC